MIFKIEKDFNRVNGNILIVFVIKYSLFIIYIFNEIFEILVGLISDIKNFC